MARDIGGKEERYMKKKIKYTKEPTGELKVIKDFLPPPDQLVLKEENVKVTIALKKSSVDFFSFFFACFVDNTKVWGSECVTCK